MDTSKRKYNLSDFQRQFISSAVGSASTSLLLSPLTVVKVRLQNMVNSTSSVRLVDVIRNIYRTEGIGGFWNGGKTALIQGLPSSIVYLTTYERMKKELSSRRNIGSASVDSNSTATQVHIPIVAATVARTLAVTCVAPLELIRTIQAGGIEKSITGIVRDVVQQTGVRGLYKGWSSTLMRDVPYSALYWTSFERLKPLYRDLFIRLLGPAYSGSSSQSIQTGTILSTTTFLAGATAGGASAIVTHPFDVLKTATQLEHIELQQQQDSSHGRNGKATSTSGVALTRPLPVIATTASSAGSSSAVAETLKTSCCNHSNHNHTHTSVHSSVHQPSSVVSRVSDTFRVYINWLLRNKNEHQCCVNSHRCSANNSVHVLVNIYKRHGLINGLYRGLSLRLLMVIPGGAVLVTIYETVQRHL